MYKHFITFLVSLRPLFFQAIAISIIDALDAKYGRKRPIRPAYPTYRRQSYTSYTRPRQNYSEFGAHRQPYSPKGFHDVIMVAFDVSGPDAKTAHEWLTTNLPKADYTHHVVNGEVHLDSWWVANDQRFDRSDQDSAVFVRRGKQAEARKLLRHHGLVD